MTHAPDTNAADPAQLTAPEPRASRATTVGRSKRTPAKHELMNKLYGREVGVIGQLRQVSEGLWLDCTAGDGAATEGRPWHKSCSPGILAHHARYRQPKPVRVVLHEQAPGTYTALLGNLAANLPGLGYQQVDEAEWTHAGGAHLSAVLSSGAEADLSGIRDSTAVMVSNDPNSIADWALTPRMIATIRNRTQWCLGISTMGCNVGGLKRWEIEKRRGWYDHVGSHVRGLNRWHDLYLCAIARDDSQWAYLIEAPTASNWRGRVQADAENAFGNFGMTLRSAWFRTDRDQFVGICHELFLTRNERDGGAA